MRVAEVFYSVQGEGILIGTPSVFIRTSGCNLFCGWCDTPYASWNPEGDEHRLDAILALVRKHPARHVVVTGGEPLIAPDVVVLTEALKADGFHITVETAGTVFAPVVCDLMSLSPKLFNSTPRGPGREKWAVRHEKLRLQPDVLRQLMAAYQYQLKFVIQQPEDLDEVRNLLGSLGADRSRIVLMPEGTDPKVLHERSLWLVEMCKQEGFRFSPRLHIDIYGNRRGV